MFNKWLLLIFFALLSRKGYGQLPEIVLQKTYGGTEMDVPVKILSRNFNGQQEYYVAARSLSGMGHEKSHDGFGMFDVWLLALNQDGVVLWDTIYGGSQADGPEDMLIYDDKIYLLAFSDSGISGNKTSPNFGDTDIWLLCLDFDGSILWQQSYGGDAAEGAFALSIFEDELFILGSSASDVSGNKTSQLYGGADYWVLKIDPENGDIISQKSVGSENFDVPIEMKHDEEGNVYLLGTSMFGVSGLKTEEGFGGWDHWIVILDSDLSLVGQACYGGTEDELPFDGSLTYFNNSLFVTGTTLSGASGTLNQESFGESDIFVYALELNLNHVWGKRLGGSLSENPSLIEVFQNHLVLAGSSTSDVSGNKTSTNQTAGIYDNWIIIMDLQGNIIEQESFGGLNNDLSTSFAFNEANNLVLLSSSMSGVGGHKDDFLRGNNDIWLVEVNTAHILSTPPYAQDFTLNVFPNPLINDLNLIIPGDIVGGHLRIVDVHGTILFDQINLEQKVVFIDLTHFSSGLLFYQYSKDDVSVSGKLIKL